MSRRAEDIGGQELSYAEVKVSANPSKRAVINGIERLLGSYLAEIARIEQEASIAESQLHDYESRLGQTFAYENYLSELTQLRNALKGGLSSKTDPTKPADGPSVSELVTRIKALKADNTIDTSQTRTGRRHTTSEEPVTARILRKQEAAANSAVTPGITIGRRSGFRRPVIRRPHSSRRTTESGRNFVTT